MKVLGFDFVVKNCVLRGKDDSGKRLTDTYVEVLYPADIARLGGIPVRYRVNGDVSPIIDRGDGKPYTVKPGDPENQHFSDTPGSTSASPDVGVNQNYEEQAPNDGHKAGFLPQLGPLADDFVGQSVSAVFTSPDGSGSLAPFKVLPFSSIPRK